MSSSKSCWILREGDVMRIIHHFYPRTLLHHVVALDEGADPVKLGLTKLEDRKE